PTTKALQLLDRLVGGAEVSNDPSHQGQNVNQVNRTARRTGGSVGHGKASSWWKGRAAGLRFSRRSRRAAKKDAGLLFTRLRGRHNLGCRVRFGFVLPAWWEQPGPDVVRHGPQPRVADRLTVHRGHVRYLMTHDEVGGGLVAGFVGHGLEGVTESVE